MVQLDTPPIYQFPPLFTRQPNKSIRIKQIETWINIILKNCELNKIWSITKTGQLRINNESNNNVNIFTNDQIHRSCSQIFINEIWSTMIKNNQLLNKDGKPPNIIHITEDDEAEQEHEEFFILWKSLDLWANEFLDWFETTGQLNKVITFYEIVSDENNRNESFYLMPETLLYQILKRLVKRGRATMLKENSKYVAIKVI